MREEWLPDLNLSGALTMNMGCLSSSLRDKVRSSDIRMGLTVECQAMMSPGHFNWRLAGQIQLVGDHRGKPRAQWGDFISHLAWPQGPKDGRMDGWLDGLHSSLH